MILSDLQTKSFNYYLNSLRQAHEMMVGDTFNTKSAKNDCISWINSAYEDLREIVQREYLDSAPTYEERNAFADGRGSNLYDNLPFSLTHLRQKHLVEIRDLYPHLSEIAFRMEALIDLRNEVKETEVATKQVKVKDEVTVRIERTIAEMMEKVKSDFAYGLRMDEHFGGLRVTANVHYVTNQHGHTFLRAFYYMNGRFTRLNTIIAVMQEIEAKKESKTA